MSKKSRRLSVFAEQALHRKFHHWKNPIISIRKPMNITVYAASSGKVSDRYLTVANALGREMARRGYALINGAGRTGLMGATIEGVLAEGGTAIGIIPQFMVDNGWQNDKMTELIITPDMHTRKEKMAKMNDGCIACPGGIGTLEELCEIITWRQLGLYSHPVVILNIDGYYDPFLAMLEQATQQHFMRPTDIPLWYVAETVEEALRLIDEHAHDAVVQSFVNQFSSESK